VDVIQAAGELIFQPEQFLQFRIGKLAEAAFARGNRQFGQFSCPPLP